MGIWEKDSLSDNLVVSCEKDWVRHKLGIFLFLTFSRSLDAKDEYKNKNRTNIANTYACLRELIDKIYKNLAYLPVSGLDK